MLVCRLGGVTMARLVRMTVRAEFLILTLVVVMGLCKVVVLSLARFVGLDEVTILRRCRLLIVLSVLVPLFLGVQRRVIYLVNRLGPA